MFRIINLICILSAFCLLPGCSADNSSVPPNIVYIFADDLGYGDLSCFGASDIHTPNIDRLAAEGIKFTEFYSASSVCSPSRAGLLTGRYPQRMGINSVFFPESFTGMPSEEITIAEMLKEKGYSTGIVGKWHLGHHYQFLPLQQGFDEYYGIPYSNDMKSVVYMHGNEVVEYEVDQRYITKTYTEKSIDFINKHADKPFFLYIAHSMPHVPIYASEGFIGTSGRGLYGDVIQELDWSVGRVLQTLNELNLTGNTLIIFSSDNGPWLVMEDHGGSAGILRSGKQYTFEGGMRVPTVAMWKNTIPEGVVYNDIAAQIDWFPTIANIVDYNITDSHVIDGVDITNVLLGKGERANKKYLFMDGADPQCYRSGQYKIKKPFEGYAGTRWKNAEPAHDTLLIDLKKDPGEMNNLFNEHKEVTIKMFNEFHEEYEKLGELPPSLIVSSGVDNSHFKFLKEKHGNNK
jgi:arylsulfatase A-like enzyme